MNISLNLFGNQFFGSGGMSFKRFSTFCFDGHFVQRSGTILVEGHSKKIFMKLF